MQALHADIATVVETVVVVVVVVVVVIVVVIVVAPVVVAVVICGIITTLSIGGTHHSLPQAPRYPPLHLHSLPPPHGRRHHDALLPISLLLTSLPISLVLISLLH